MDGVQIYSAVLLTVITILIGWTANYTRKSFRRHLNRIDIAEWKVSSINYACEESMGENFTKPRDTKWEELVEKDKLLNKKR